MGIFDLTGRFTLVMASDNISKLRAIGYLSEHYELYQEVKEQYSELFNELVNQRDLINSILELSVDEKLTKIKEEWFSNRDTFTSGVRTRERINNISDRNQRMLDFLPDIEKRWFRHDDMDFKEYPFENLKDYCIYSSLRAVPKKYLKDIYEHYKYTSTVEYPIKISFLHSLWDQINCRLASYN